MIDYPITFIIHLRKDTEEREKNVNLIIEYYKDILPKCKFIIVEDDKTQKFSYLKDKPDIKYYFLFNEGLHNKCRGYNYGLHHSEPGLICFLDADCLISLENIKTIINSIDSKPGIYIGYNGTSLYFTYSAKKTIQTSRGVYDFLMQFIDLNNIQIGNTCDYYRVTNNQAVGGALFGYKSIFEQIKGFNPNFKGWGYEDNEIIIRSRKLGIDLYYTNSSKPYLLHLPHLDERETSSESRHENYYYNQMEFIKICNLNKQQIQEYISTWQLI